VVTRTRTTFLTATKVGLVINRPSATFGASGSYAYFRRTQ